MFIIFRCVGPFSVLRQSRSLRFTAPKHACHIPGAVLMAFLGIVPRKDSIFLISEVGLGLIDTGADPRSKFNISEDGRHAVPLQRRENMYRS